MKPYKIIHANVYDPTGFSLFGKRPANTPAETQTILCNNSENCDLFKAGTCSFRPALGWSTCEYGRYNVEVGPTKRAKNFRTWIGEKRALYKDVPHLKDPANKLAFVGDYVYIPYAHVNMNKALPFARHNEFFVRGDKFLKKSDWTIETVTKICMFSPQALFGGTITSYQNEEIPKFIMHLEEVDKPMYDKLAETQKAWFEARGFAKKNYIGRTALLATVNPCTFTTKGSREGNYRVTWKWDGKVLTTTSPHAYNSTWGDINTLEGIALILYPTDKTTIPITDNAQVNSNTKFID